MIDTVLKSVVLFIAAHEAAGTSPSVAVAGKDMEAVASGLAEIDAQLAELGYERDTSRDNPDRGITGGVAGLKPDMSVNSASQGAIFVKKI